jgi:hypothetical protein
MTLSCLQGRLQHRQGTLKIYINIHLTPEMLVSILNLKQKSHVKIELIEGPENLIPLMAFFA